MAYVSLYRKYRPQSFADVVGQDHVIQTLVNAIDEDRLHHAYLFTGPRGTGKTSTARLLAKAINCDAGPTSTPCETCDQCVAITHGSSVDVIELDMASHGGVDDARELRDRALFAPASARRKVYILDEVHMASTAAFNALLKLIEEPPAHVLFAMATTDPQKVLPTILSRVQRLDLRRVGAADVAGNVRRLCELEGYRIDDGAVDAVVRAGDGSVRDTQSVLEQVLAFAGTEVTAAAVAQVLGATPMDRVEETVDRLAERDLAGLLGLVQSLLNDGYDLRRFTLDLVQHLRDLLVIQVAPDRPDLVDATDDRRSRLQAQAGVLPRESLLRAVDQLAATVAEQRQGSPRLPLELCLAQLAIPGADGDLAELADRLARLEGAARPSAGRTAPAAAAADSAAHRPAAAPREAAPASSPETADATTADATTAEATAADARDAAGAGNDRPEAAASTPSSLEPATLEARARARAGSGDEPAPSQPVRPSGQPVDGARSSAGSVPAAADAPGDDAASAGDAAPVAEPVAEPPGGSVPDPPAVAADAPAEVLDVATAEPSPGAAAAGDASAGDAPAGDASAGDAPVDDASAGAAPAGDAPADDGADDSDPLTVVLAHWDGTLELVRQASKRCHALFEPATPVSASRGILTLKYARRYASFHAANAKRSEFADVLREALERACGLKLRLDVVIDGEDERRRPMPPTVTPQDARTPVIDGQSVDLDEEAEVREAENAPAAPADDVDVDTLLATELGAKLHDEQPPPGETA